MHEELYFKSKDPLRVLLFVSGILLLPFSFCNFSIVSGEPKVVFLFDLPLLLGAAGLSALFFLPFDQRKEFLLIPYGAVLAAEFLRFGTVTIFERAIPFDRYITAAVFMLASFFAVFFLFFIAQGKLRSKLPLFILPGVLCAAAICSMIFSFPPFFVLEEITEGARITSVSYGAAFILYNATVVMIALNLCSDRVRDERKKRNNEKT